MWTCRYQRSLVSKCNARRIKSHHAVEWRIQAPLTIKGTEGSRGAMVTFYWTLDYEANSGLRVDIDRRAPPPRCEWAGVVSVGFFTIHFPLLTMEEERHHVIEIGGGESSRFITAYHFRGPNNLSISPRGRFVFPRVLSTLSKKAL